MKLYKAARTVLHVTALAWAIPFAQADDAEFVKRHADASITGKALPVASTVSGVASVKDGRAVRNN